MRDLIFCTSNSTKLSHARYLMEGQPARIKGFRQHTYHANYEEPRVASREELLKASYENALRQFARARISTDTNPFILEDTSVRIDALSTDGEDRPGLDIKFWMQDQTFADLDAALKERGNVRTASVRSDLLLHIPESLRQQWGIDEPYLTFVGQQTGSIVAEEYKFKTNLVYPWLDDQSFNKWFQLDGCKLPFGALSIDEADPVDFRRASFEKLISFLLERSYFRRPASQMALSLDKKPNLILCGYTCAGKTVASQHLARSYGYLHVEASDFMHLSYLYRHGFPGPVAIGDFAEQALAEKPDIAAEKIAEYISDYLSSPIIISGFRALEEIEALSSSLASKGKDFETVFVEADEQTRFERLRARMRLGDDVDLQTFQTRDQQQERMGLERIRSEDIAAIQPNMDSLNAYFSSIDQRVGDVPPDEIDIPAALSRVASLEQVKLEDALLIALLSVWEENETRPFFTTTRIAAIVGDVFKAAPSKHKDNVSRYFNQDFYAYYEIELAEDGKTRGYRLSNTGYGMAVRSLRKLTRPELPEPGF